MCEGKPHRFFIDSKFLGPGRPSDHHKTIFHPPATDAKNFNLKTLGQEAGQITGVGFALRIHL